MPVEMRTFSTSSMLNASVVRYDADAKGRSGARSASPSASTRATPSASRSFTSDESEALGEEEGQVAPAVAPFLELHLADARPIVDADLREARPAHADRLD